jgi:5-methylcytosine-specific restriction endonuclease McrA
MKHSKTCNKCGQSKANTEFGIRKGKPGQNDYLRQPCKQCERLVSKEWKQNNKQKAWANAQSWRSKNKIAWAEIQQKSYQQNKAKRQQSMADYRKDNPEKLRTYANNRRALELAAKSFLITQKDISRLLMKDCAYCKLRPSQHIDHIIPLSRGGDNSLGNLTGSCASCNLSKGSKFLMEWKRGRK